MFSSKKSYRVLVSFLIFDNNVLTGEPKHHLGNDLKLIIPDFDFDYSKDGDKLIKLHYQA